MCVKPKQTFGKFGVYRTRPKPKTPEGTMLSIHGALHTALSREMAFRVL